MGSLPFVFQEICLAVIEKEPDPPKPPTPPPPPPVVETTKPPSPKKPIDPALQETDSSLLESIVSKPPLILNPKLDDTGKELTVKTGTRIADSILQKFNSIKNNIETKVNKPEPSTSSATSIGATSSTIEKLDSINPTAKTENAATEPGPSGVELKPKPPPFEIKPRLSLEIKPKIEQNPKPLDILKFKPAEILSQMNLHMSKPSTSKLDAIADTRRRRRPLSKPIVEESETDSSDSEHLVIGSEEDNDDDDDSQTNSSDNKPLIECKNTDSNMSLQVSLYYNILYFILDFINNIFIFK